MYIVKVQANEGRYEIGIKSCQVMSKARKKEEKGRRKETKRK
jgi:hypothetical protein